MEGHLDRLETLDARRFRILVRRLADSLSYGTDSSPFLGSGIEYVQSRPYAPGDPVRTIDWRVTARTGEPYVKEFESPKRMPCYLLVDTSASMTIGSTPRTKYETAVYIAGGIAFACLDRVSPVGIVGVGERDLLVRPTLSKGQILQWLTALRRFRFDETTTLARRIAELAPSLHHRVLIVVLSDLHDLGAAKALERLAKLHDVAVIQLRDPAEEGVRGSGILRAREAETGRGFVTLGRRRWLSREEWEVALRRRGIDHLILSTDGPIEEPVRRFFGTRGLLGRGAR